MGETVYHRMRTAGQDLPALHQEEELVHLVRTMKNLTLAINLHIHPPITRHGVLCNAKCQPKDRADLGRDRQHHISTLHLHTRGDHRQT